MNNLNTTIPTNSTIDTSVKTKTSTPNNPKSDSDLGAYWRGINGVL